MWPNPGLSLKELADLGEELYELMKTPEGATPTNIAGKPILMRLRVAYDLARSDGPARPTQAAIAQALRGLVESATYPLSSYDGASIDKGKAARIYLAIEPDSGALLLKDRRKLAEQYIPYEKLRSAAKDLPNKPRYERRLLRRVADNLIEREFDHLDGLARSQLARADSWSPQPHATIYKTHRSVFSLWILLQLIHGRKAVYGFVTQMLGNPNQTELFPVGTDYAPKYAANMMKYQEKLINENYDLRLMALIMLGRLFLTAEFLGPHNVPKEEIDPSQLSAREALAAICVLVPLDIDQAHYLTSVYIDGKTRCEYQPRYSSFDPPVFTSGDETEEELAIVRWVFREYSKTEWEPLERLLHDRWDPWVLCDCMELMSHDDNCPVGALTTVLERYKETLESAWQRLREAMQSPTFDRFAGLQDGRRLYHDLGLTL